MLEFERPDGKPIFVSAAAILSVTEDLDRGPGWSVILYGAAHQVVRGTPAEIIECMESE